MLLAPIIWVLTVGIVYFFAAKTWWFPPPINQHGMDYDAQFMRTLIVVGIVFTLAQFALGWVIMKFRMRTVLDDPTTEAELFDVNFQNPSVGAMSLRLYDHRSGDRTLDVPNPVVSVGAWFQLEAFYRDAADATGRLTLWLNGVQILDLPGATGPTAWVAWDVVSVGDDLTPDTAIIYVDDCAISQSRVGLTGLIAQ